MPHQEYLPISEHQTLNCVLMVDWSTDYHNEFQCPECSSNQLYLCHHPIALEKRSLRCKNCGKNTKLSYQIRTYIYKYQPGLNCRNSECTKLGPDGRTKGWVYLSSEEKVANRYICHYCNFRFYERKKPYAEKHPLISYHKTLHGTLIVDWRKDYYQEYPCLVCGSDQNYPCYNPHYPEKRSLRCKVCTNQIPLTCRNRPYIFRYQAGRNCPNPLCTKLAPDNKSTGWVYSESANNIGFLYRCHYCNITFKPGVKKSRPKAWDYKNQIKPFNFDEDIWDLRNFYEKSGECTINFDFEPGWYRQAAKNYIHMLLKARSHALNTISAFVCTLRKFGQLLQQQQITQVENINREVIRTYINSQKDITSITLNDNLKRLKYFFEWLGLDDNRLIRNRDLAKEAPSDPEWLDETVRNSIKQHVGKLPAPIACLYLVQDYTAARPRDVCLIPFNCLVEDNGQWYIEFFQHKVKRWHRIPANREIRQLIEAQQQWIRQTLGINYNYLFCRFRNLRSHQYPHFSALKPLLTPPNHKMMVRAVRLLIEKEDIRDSNGQRPHFTSKIIRASKLQEVRAKHGLNAAQLYADHQNRNITYRHYTPPTQEQLAKVDLPFQELLLNPNNRFLAWQSLPESLLKNPKAHELDIEIAPRLVVYGHCTLDPKTPCPINLYPKCYGCGSFRPSTSKLSLYERQYAGEYERMQRAKEAEAELAYEEAKTTIEAMDKWLPELKKLANGEEA